MTIARFVLGLGAVVLAGCTVTRSGESVRPSHIPVASRTVELSGLQFVAHKGWISREPASRMRAAEYVLASGESGGRDASLVVYYFGPGSAGSVDANIERWCNQFTQRDGRDSYDVVRIDTRQINTLAVHAIDLGGTYVAETSPGSAERLPQNRQLRLPLPPQPSMAAFSRLASSNRLFRSRNSCLR